MLVSQTTSYGRMGVVPDADELSRKEVFFFLHRLCRKGMGIGK